MNSIICAVIMIHPPEVSGKLARVEKLLKNNHLRLKIEGYGPAIVHEKFTRRIQKWN